jgi:para-aminobenzoate synthetase/4-amino-4-deoxychorismate lyase
VATRRWLCFASPPRTLIAARLADVLPVLQEVEQAVRSEGVYAVGLVSYEASPAFDAALTTRVDDRFPYAWFGLYGPPEERDFLPGDAWVGPLPFAWVPSVTPAEYRQSLAAVREYIGNGDTYQVNFTYRLRSPCQAEPWPLFLRLVQAQDPPCGAFVDTGDWVVCSASPELFFRQDGTRIASRPMKGTAARGLWSADDRRRAAELCASEKDRAENVMIVDMVRNDLGRVADMGSVAVPELFAVEQYPTVWQMTSTVAARTDAPLPRLFQAIFPPASIPGAPKCRTMEIIAELETSPRRVYTGAVGFVTPDGRAQFNVAIRTVLLDRARGEAEYGVGGGIVWDSDCDREADECRTKSRILEFSRPPFELLESVLWRPGRGYYLLRRHLQRLRESAAYFGFPLDMARVREELARVVVGLPASRHKVRLLLSRQGTVRVEAALIAANPAGPIEVALAREPVDSGDVFLYHKTTCRRIYEEAVTARPGVADVILYNRRGEVTESTVANVVVETAGVLCTPPLRCGLLPGTCRAELLARGTIRERAITIEELLRSPAVFLINSVRGRRSVRVLRPD